MNTITYDKGNLLDIIVGEGAFHQEYRGMYINIINTITYDNNKNVDINIIAHGTFLE